VSILILEERDEKDNKKGKGVYRAAITKVAGHTCSDQWWTQNKDDVFNGITAALTYQGNVVEGLKAMVEAIGAVP